MDIKLLFLVLARSVAGVLVAQGKSEEAALLNDLASAARTGKNVDDLLLKYAEDWATNGEPSFEQIAAMRKAIQERM